MHVCYSVCVCVCVCVYVGVGVCGCACVWEGGRGRGRGRGGGGGERGRKVCTRRKDQDYKAEKHYILSMGKEEISTDWDCT